MRPSINQNNKTKIQDRINIYFAVGWKGKFAKKVE